MMDAPVELDRFLWLVVPGLMWHQHGRTRLGSGVCSAWAVMVMIHIATIHGSLAYLAATVASVLHAVSAAAVLSVIYPYWQGTGRIVKTVLYTSLLVFLLYSVVLRSVVNRFAQRITTQGATVMIHGDLFSARSWAQGDWVAYHLPGGQLNMDRILAGPGDTLRFHRDSFEVNGRFFQRVSPKMPTDGEVVVNEGCYFIWPTTANFINYGGQFENYLLNLTQIDKTRIVGKPYRRWLWNSSTLEKLKPIPFPATSTQNP